MPISPPLNDLNLVYRLRTATGDAPRGLVILLHGVGSNEAAMAPLADFFPPDLSVALVRSPLTLGPDQYAYFRVNFTPNGPIIDSQAAESSRLALLNFLQALQAKLGIAPQKTIVAGFSQGGIMSASVALTAPETVGGFGILSGRILPEIAPLIAPREHLRQLAAWLSHGDHDAVLPASWADRSRSLLAELQIPTDEQRYAAGHELTPAIVSQFATWAEATIDG